MIPQELTVYLADDDADDRLLFEEAIRELNEKATLTMAKNGEQLMVILKNNTPPPPHLIFLDLNMPLKNGFECLEEIRGNAAFKNIPVVVFSTSCQEDAIESVYQKGADHYICKPDNYKLLKVLLNKVISIHRAPGHSRPSREDFLLSA